LIILPRLTLVLNESEGKDGENVIHRVVWA